MTQQTDFDYIIVGSGAGGGPLAARLALAGKKVLVLEAGPNQAAQPGPAREVSQVPGFHAVSTEHEDLSWEFFVNHYENPPTGQDPKWNTTVPNPPPSEGIFYPRASGVGGCTVHNAMITIAGPDSDWEDLADFVVDDTWRANVMRGYFERLERNDYLRPPRPIPTSWLGRLLDNLRWLVGRSVQDSRGKHGFKGWLHTSFTDFALGLGDRQLTSVLFGAIKQSRLERLDRSFFTIARSFLSGKGLDGFDPNHSETQAESPEGIVSVPLAVCGPDTTMHQNSETPFVMRGRRSSPREFLFEVQARHPERLVIETDILVTGVLFDPDPAGGAPRAVGVSFQRGSRLYRATKRHPGELDPSDGQADSYAVKPKGEIVLCGGAFNTPQLLMLSGLGNAGELAKMSSAANPDPCVLRDRDGKPLRDSANQTQRINLPGIGKNLQDRYEVTLINEMPKDFSLLNGASFKVPNATTPPDAHLLRWRQEGRGLYTSNGAVLGIFKRSNPDLEQPDLFIFGIPLPFYGYEVGYSNAGRIHNQFTWAILKGHTRNTDGTVRLRTLNPRDTPDINFHYFNETTCRGKSDDDPDLNALVEGFKFVRGILRRTRKFSVLVTAVGPQLGEEIHPGDEAVPDGNERAMKDWIRRVAWGHHACGTCRMGPEGDPEAVLTSRFAVRGVSGLRVVDASIFPKIPGYFVVANIYMASEKAADVLLEDAEYGHADAPVYPHELREKEAAAITHRRTNVRLDPRETMAAEAVHEDIDTWNDDVTGLALSGGGVRSATFCLGALQAMARHRWLRRIDFLSTVSGGGYIGSFIGRWFDRLRPANEWGGSRAPMHSVPDRIERELNDSESPALRWLRAHGNYIAPQGDGDARSDTAVYLRSLLSVHVVVGSLLFTLFGLANLVRYLLFDPVFAIVVLVAEPTPVGGARAPWQVLVDALTSPWLLIAGIVVSLTVVPKIAAYWVVSQDRHGRYSGPPLMALFVVVLGLLMVGLTQFNLIALAYAFLLPFTTMLYAELARYRGRLREAAIGRGNVETQRLRTRNQLTTDLGGALRLTAVVLVFAVVDTLGHFIQQWRADSPTYVVAFASIAAIMTALAPLLRWIADLFAGEHTDGTATGIGRMIRSYFAAGMLASALFVIPLVIVAFVAHTAYDGGLDLTRGLLATLFAAVLSAICAHPKALAFVNRSSFSNVYAARLARAYLGASNPVRHRPQGANVTEVVAGDDVASIRDYRPFTTGGPFHLINMTVNQTVDFTSQRGNRDRKGDNVAVSCLAMSIGELWHATWRDRVGPVREGLGRRRPAALKPIGYLAGADHPLVDAAGKATNNAEMLSLRQWMGISGAAVGPGQGQTTELGTSLLFGLANLRTGYWWNSGIEKTGRDGFPTVTFFRRLGYVLRDVFLTQSLLISEWIARFPGPWDRFWHLSDGGFFEVLGAYELIRRRVPRMIVCDGSADPKYTMESVANLMRKARIDFNAILKPFTSEEIEKHVPDTLRPYVGTLRDMCPEKTTCGTTVSRTHAALFWVTYTTAPARPSLLLYVKASLTGDETADVLHYRTAHPDFPHEATVDQFFNEAQWESYRCLGDHVFERLCEKHGGKDGEKDGWFWSIELTQGESNAV